MRLSTAWLGLYLKFVRAFLNSERLIYIGTIFLRFDSQLFFGGEGGKGDRFKPLFCYGLLDSVNSENRITELSVQSIKKHLLQ